MMIIMTMMMMMIMMMMMMMMIDYTIHDVTTSQPDHRFPGPSGCHILHGDWRGAESILMSVLVAGRV
jgi:hypothetical protein